MQLTIFDELNSDCMDALLNWLPLNRLCLLSKTCKGLQSTCKKYFARNYQSEEFTVGDEFVFEEQHWDCFGDVVQNLRLYDSNLDDYAFAASNANGKLRAIAFDRTFKDENDISRDHIDKIVNLLENVKTVRAVDCNFSDGNNDYLLEKCKHIEDFAFTAPKKFTKSRFQFRKYPTLRNIEVHFHSKANVMEAIKAIRDENSNLDELVLLFCKEHSSSMEFVFMELDSMFAAGFFKRLFLMFDNKSMVAEHIDRLTKVGGLHGLTCSYTINGTITMDQCHMADITKLQNLKFLNINWLLGNADEIAKELQQLEELEVSTITVDAITSFVRYSGKLMKFHIEQIRINKEFKMKFDASDLNKERMKLDYARKLVIFIPEDKFIKLKWAKVNMDSLLVEIKREESYIPQKRNQERNDANSGH